MRSIRDISRSTSVAGAIALAAGLAFLAQTADASPATSSAPHWSAVKIATPSGKPNGLTFATITCPTASTCWATVSSRPPREKRR